MFRSKIAALALTVAAALSPLALAGPARADEVNAGCGTYTALVTPEIGQRVGLRPPYDNPYRGTGAVVSVDDDQLVTVNRDVDIDAGLTTRHEYVRYCDTEAAALASAWGNWAAWPLQG